MWVTEQIDRLKDYLKRKEEDKKAAQLRELDLLKTQSKAAEEELKTLKEIKKYKDKIKETKEFKKKAYPSPFANIRQEMDKVNQDMFGTLPKEEKKDPFRKPDFMDNPIDITMPKVTMPKIGKK